MTIPDYKRLSRTLLRRRGEEGEGLVHDGVAGGAEDLAAEAGRGAEPVGGVAAGVGAKYLLKHASAEDEPRPKMTKAYCFSLAVSILLVKIMRLYHVSLAVHAPPFSRLTFDDFCTE